MFHSQGRASERFYPTDRRRDEVVEVTVRRGGELEHADGTIELGDAAPAVTLSPPLWVVATLLIGFCFLGKWPWREVAW